MPSGAPIRGGSCHAAWLLLLFAWQWAWGQAAWGQTPVVDPQSVAARVEDFEIRAADVQRVVRQALGGRQVPPQEQRLLEAQSLEQLISRRLVEQSLIDRGIAVSQRELDQARSDLTQKLAAGNVSLEQFMQQQLLDDDALNAQLRWEQAWRKLLAAELTDERLAATFDADRRQFDGTRLRASHILLRIPPAGGPQAAQQTLQQAAALRAQIVDGALTFAEAAEQYSAGPSRRAGGDLGLVGRDGPMVEEFSAALFRLQEGEISRPVATSFGIHLIQCTGTDPGSRTWQEARARLEPAAAQQLFNEIAATARATARVEYTGAMPYIDPATRNLVLPRNSGS